MAVVAETGTASTLIRDGGHVTVTARQQQHGTCRAGERPAVRRRIGDGIANGLGMPGRPAVSSALRWQPEQINQPALCGGARGCELTCPAGKARRASASSTQGSRGVLQRASPQLVQPPIGELPRSLWAPGVSSGDEND